MSSYTRSDTQFQSHGITCRAWLYNPEDPNGAVIVMGHGLGGTRDAGLEPFAVRFAEQGYTVLVFDYRHFGSSDGEPRQLLSIHKQLEDWRSAVAYARTLPSVDAARIGLWGTSFSGGHVLATAARDPQIAAVSSANPMVDGFAACVGLASYAGIGKLLRLTAYGLADQIRALLGLSPVTIPLVAMPGEFATMTSEDAYHGYSAIAPPGFRNEMTTRMALVLMAYRPIAKAAKIHCPVLMQVCLRDTVAPAPAALKMAQKLGSRVQLKQYDIGHFDIYVGEEREMALKHQSDFFGQVLNAQGKGKV